MARGLEALAALAAVLLFTGCASDDNSPAAEATSQRTETAPPRAIDPKLVGEWERETQCAELAQALGDAGMEELVDEFVAGNGFIPGVGVDDPERIDVEEPCRGAVPRVHSHFFTEDGEFGSRDWNGEDVDEGTYRADGEKLVISKEFPDVTFRYRIEGDTLMLDPEVDFAGCTTFRCGWSVAVAYPGKTWTRTR